ncbi:MAG: DUF58 domain-containing protein [Lachnospiraceae bacterium]|nr:DUF58 domain-containing protein [Lachnospiraceae bacterium]
MSANRIGKLLIGILVFAVALIPAVFINTLYGYLPAFSLALALVLSIASLQLVRRRITVESDLGGTDSICERGKKIAAGLRVCNHSRIMTSKTVVNIFISDLFGGEDSLNQMYLALAPGKDTGFGLNIAMPHIGVYRGGVRDMEMWDFFGFFKVTVPLDGTFEVFVRPRIRPMEEVRESETVLAESARDTRTVVSGGMDYVGVREYAMGDSMKQIHWKLSAHSPSYMTKLQESSREIDYSVVLDFAAARQEEKEVMMDLQDALIETSLSLIDEISRHHTSYSLLYCDRHHAIRRVRPKGREDDLELVKDFCVVTPDPDAAFPDACRILKEEGSVASRSTNVIVVTSRVTDELLQEMARIRRQRRVPELYQVVPAGLNSREVEALRARLHLLDEAGVSHYFVYTTDAGGEAA